MMTQANSPEAILESGVVEAVLDQKELSELRGELDRITVRPELVDYLVGIVRATRAHESVLVGAGPRATQALLLGSRVRAALDGRDFVTPDDIKELAGPILEHRLVLRPEFEIEGLGVGEVINRVLAEISVPR